MAMIFTRIQTTTWEETPNFTVPRYFGYAKKTLEKFNIKLESLQRGPSRTLSWSHTTQKPNGCTMCMATVEKTRLSHRQVRPILTQRSATSLG